MSASRGMVAAIQVELFSLLVNNLGHSNMVLHQFQKNDATVDFNPVFRGAPIGYSGFDESIATSGINFFELCMMNQHVLLSRLTDRKLFLSCPITEISRS